VKSHDIFNWTEYEATLYKGLHEAVNRIIEKYPNIQFYGMCIDCNAEYGQVLLHLNTETDIRNNNKEEYWDVGDWKYFDLMDELQEKDKFFDIAWKKHEDYITKNMFKDDTPPTDDFMAMIAKVANDLGNSEAIKTLNKTEKFRIVAVDHDEDIEEGYERMINLRNT
jgi:hypothetical protein